MADTLEQAEYDAALVQIAYEAEEPLLAPEQGKDQAITADKLL